MLIIRTLNINDALKVIMFESNTSMYMHDMFSFSSFGPRQANLVLITYASSEGSGEPAHPRSLARTFAAHSYKQ